MTATARLNTLRTTMLAAGLAVLLATADSAGATPQKRAPTDANSAGSAAICGTFGGNASVVNDGVDLQIEGSKGASKTSTTHCQGGLLGGMTCDNYDNGTSNCAMPLAGGDHQTEITVDEPVEPTGASPTVRGASDEGRVSPGGAMVPLEEDGS